jgi:predicted phage-related endonuclease
MRLISPSKVASICGISRWESQYSLWLRMKGIIDPKPPKDIFAVGLAFESAMAYLWKEDNPGWRLSPGEVQYVTDAYSFPACATIDRRASRGKLRRIVEMKIAHHTDEWGDPDLTGDCPADYALQVIAQQLFCELRDTAHLMVMGPFFKHRIYTIEFDQKVADWMVSECRQFWESLHGDVPPPLDDSVSTYMAVREQHPDITYGLKREIPEALLEDWRMVRAEHATSERTLRGLKTKILDTVGDAQYVCVNGEIVAARQPHGRGGIALVLKDC